jgi:hypothetical protein
MDFVYVFHSAVNAMHTESHGTRAFFDVGKRNQERLKATKPQPVAQGTTGS